MIKPCNFSLPGFVEELQATMPLSSPVALQAPLADSSQEECDLSQCIFFTILHGVLFVPWCATVGRALLLFPQKLELVVFHPGYNSQSCVSSLIMFSQNIALVPHA
ncbi:hypothetical protein BDR04DRAFT_1164943 [Suillus decipiens]|nr:hypothetical protein BDR04DRAFT_1164943 [Suillus decipiens]